MEDYRKAAQYNFSYILSQGVMDLIVFECARMEYDAVNMQYDYFIEKGTEVYFKINFVPYGVQVFARESPLDKVHNCLTFTFDNLMRDFSVLNNKGKISIMLPSLEKLCKLIQEMYYQTIEKHSV